MNVQVGLVAAEPSSGSTLLHDLAAEQQLLGACLVWPDAVDLTASILEPEHFFEPVHAQIFEWLRDMRSRGQRTSAPLLIAQLGQLGHIDILGLPLSVFVARLCTEATTGVNVPDFAKVVRDWWERRQMQAVLESGLEWIRCAPVEVLPAEIRNETIERLDAISSNQIPQTTRALTIGDAAREAMTNLSDTIQRNGQLAGITFGLSDLDRRTSGIHRSEVSILAARPGMGKTAVAVHVALKAAESGAHVLYCSLEMMAAALAQRALTALAFKLSGNRRGIPYSDLRSGRGITDDDFRLLRDAQDYLHGLPLVIEQQPSLSLAQIAMRARRLKQKHGLDLLILDHIHRIQPANKRNTDERLKEEFDRWYPVYPRRSARRAAFKSYKQARSRGTTPETLLHGAKRYADQRAGQDPQFTKMPATWLNGDCWLDEPEIQLADIPAAPSGNAEGLSMAERIAAAAKRALGQ